MSQEKLKTMFMHISGGVKEVYYGIYASGELNDESQNQTCHNIINQLYVNARVTWLQKPF